MPLKIEKMSESELNMTPMIDIVFQLILFFLFNLRFKSMDYRIESALPKDRGVEATPQMVEPIPSIKVSLFRLDADNPDAARTKIKIGTVHEVVLPVYKWTGKRADDMAVEKMRDAKYAEIANVIKRLREGKPEFKGEIDTPQPFGAAVPHADVIRILDSFLEAGINEVNFVGAPSPMPRSQQAPR
ncbi:MAG: biopolymer transporter ExbD [Planctomycetota bacterium]